MKHQLGAAVAALSFAVVCMSDNASAVNPSWALVTNTGYVNNELIVDGLDHLWSQVELKHLQQSVREWANISPPDPLSPPDPCRDIAVKWNVNVLKEQLMPWKDFTHKFDKLLDKMAKKQCSINFVGVQNSGGSQDILSVSPKLQ